jgi:hypothetical protein
MKTLALLLALPLPAMACDWAVTKRVDPMTDMTTCTVMSPSAKVVFYREGDSRPNVIAPSAYYQRNGLRIRIDDNPAISMGSNAWDRQKALDALLPQMKTGARIRTSFLDYPSNQAGDAPLCNLQELLDSCTDREPGG